VVGIEQNVYNIVGVRFRLLGCTPFQKDSTG